MAPVRIANCCCLELTSSSVLMIKSNHQEKSGTPVLGESQKVVSDQITFDLIEYTLK